MSHLPPLGARGSSPRPWPILFSARNAYEHRGPRRTGEQPRRLELGRARPVRHRHRVRPHVARPAENSGSRSRHRRVEQDGMEPDVDLEKTDIYSQSTGKSDENTYSAGIVNQYKNYFGKSRVVVIKSQLGQPITAYSGDEVYWKIPKKLPKMTKLMIDGKALYIHRANFQIIDTALLN